MSYYRTLIQQATSFVNLLVAAYKFENNGNDSYINAYNGTVGSAVIFSTTNALIFFLFYYISYTLAKKY